MLVRAHGSHRELLDGSKHNADLALHHFTQCFYIQHAASRRYNISKTSNNTGKRLLFSSMWKDFEEIAINVFLFF